VIAGQKEAVPHTNAPTTHGARMWLGATEIDVFSRPLPHARARALPRAQARRQKRGRPAPAAAPRLCRLRGPLLGRRALPGRLRPGSSRRRGGHVLRPQHGAAAAACRDARALRPRVRRPTTCASRCGSTPGTGTCRCAGWSAPAARGRGGQECPRTRTARSHRTSWRGPCAREGRASPPVPSLLAEERTYNPFMRVHVPSLRRAAGGARRRGQLPLPCARTRGLPPSQSQRP